jgi:hypothetical protein
VNQRLMTRLLEKSGHRVVVASNGREALAALENGSYDLVLMDIQMPEMNGMELPRGFEKNSREDISRSSLWRRTRWRAIRIFVSREGWIVIWRSLFVRKILTTFWISLLVGERRSLNEDGVYLAGWTGASGATGREVRFVSGGAKTYFLRAGVALVL